MTVRIDAMKQKLGQTNETPEASAGLPASTFETAFRENWQRVCVVLYRLVGDQDEAEDLALETFWRLYRRPAETGPAVNLPGWLYRVALNLGYNALRSRKRRRHYEEEAGTLEYLHHSPVNPAAEAERSEERERVRQVLRKMKPRSAQILILRHSGLSYAEIAKALEVAPGSIGTLLVRAEQEFEKRYQALEGKVANVKNPHH